jgi:hypothetical protein
MKKKAATPERSFLQRLHSITNWALHFQLQPFRCCDLGHEIHLSSDTYRLIDEYELTRRRLRASIIVDRDRNKKLYLANRKKLVDTK